MIQRTEKGRQARRYFIEVEKQYRAKSGLPVDVSQITRLEIAQMLVNAETERLALDAKNKQLEPKADAYDAFLDATGSYAMGTVAKMLGVGANRLFMELRNRGVLISKGAMRNTPYQRYMRYFVVKAHHFEKRDGDVGVSYTTYVQPSGIDFIRRRLELPTIDPVAFVLFSAYAEVVPPPHPNPPPPTTLLRTCGGSSVKAGSFVEIAASSPRMRR